MNRFAVTSNFLIISFLTFIIAFLWASYIFTGFFMTVTIAFLITCLVDFSWLLLASRKKRARNLTRAETEHMRDMTLQFQFMSQVATMAIVVKAIKEKLDHKKIDFEPDENIEQCEPVEIKILCDKIVVEDYNVFAMFHKKVTRADIIDCINRTTDGMKTVIFGEVSADDIAFFNVVKINVLFYSSEDVYINLLKPTGIFPELAVQYKTKSRLTFATFRTLAFSRKKTKSYILLGIVVLLTSFIVRPTIFYIVMATILFSFGIISMLRPVRKHDTLFS